MPRHHRRHCRDIAPMCHGRGRRRRRASGADGQQPAYIFPSTVFQCHRVTQRIVARPTCLCLHYRCDATESRIPRRRDRAIVIYAHGHFLHNTMSFCTRKADISVRTLYLFDVRSMKMISGPRDALSRASPTRRWAARILTIVIIFESRHFQHANYHASS